MLKLLRSFSTALLLLSFYPRVLPSATFSLDDSAALLTPTLPDNPSVQVQAASLQPGIPLTLTIAKINLTAKVVPVSLTPQGIVDTPLADIGWYQDGVKPGLKGTANFNGHVRNQQGQPGVFYHLSKLKVGDEIIVTDEHQQQFRYSVTATELVDEEKYPTAKVYGHTVKAMLNLTTCAGVYNLNRQDYTQRTIIYSELIE